MAKGLLVIVIGLIVFIGVFVFLGNRRDGQTLSPTPTPVTSPFLSIVKTASPTPPKTPIVKTVAISIIDSGFNPSEATINSGDTVRFINQNSKASWPASNIHPTHQLYPGSSIGKCGTAEVALIFDACRGLNPGESFSFTFKEKGNWFYHDHLEPSVSGKIIVQ